MPCQHQSLRKQPCKLLMLITTQEGSNSMQAHVGPNFLALAGNIVTSREVHGRSIGRHFFRFVSLTRDPFAKETLEIQVCLLPTNKPDMGPSPHPPPPPTPDCCMCWPPPKGQPEVKKTVEISLSSSFPRLRTLNIMAHTSGLDANLALPHGKPREQVGCSGGSICLAKGSILSLGICLATKGTPGVLVTKGSILSCKR